MEQSGVTRLPMVSANSAASRRWLERLIQGVLTVVNLPGRVLLFVSMIEAILSRCAMIYNSVSNSGKMHGDGANLEACRLFLNNHTCRNTTSSVDARARSILEMV